MDKIRRFFSLEALYLIILAFLPFQKRIHKIFRPLSEYFLENYPNLPKVFEKKIAFYLTDFLILGLAALFLYRKRDSLRTYLSTGITKYLLFFLGACLLSLALSSYASFGLHYVRLFQLSLGILFFCLTVQIFSHENKKQLIMLACYVVVIVSLLECGIGIAQYCLQKPLGLRVLGEVPYFSSFKMSDGSRWVFDRHVASTDLVQIKRASGTFSHPNILGGFLFFSIFFSYLLYFEAKNRLFRLFACIALFMQISTLCLTYSRSAIIAWMLASSCFFLSIFLWQKEAKDKAQRLLLSLLCFGCVCFALLYPQFVDRGGIVNYNNLVQGADSIRVQFLMTAFKMLQEHLFLGVGFNNFLLYIQQYAPVELAPGNYYYVHNIYFLIAAEMGLIGICSFLLFIFSILKNILRAQMSIFSFAFLSLFLGILFIGCCDFYPLVTQQGRLLFFTSAGMLFVCLKERKGQIVTQEKEVHVLGK